MRDAHNKKTDSHQLPTWLVQMRGAGLGEPLTPSFVRTFFGFLLQTLNHEVFQLHKDEQTNIEITLSRGVCPSTVVLGMFVIFYDLVNSSWSSCSNMSTQKYVTILQCSWFWQIRINSYDLICTFKYDLLSSNDLTFGLGGFSIAFFQVIKHFCTINNVRNHRISHLVK